MSGKGRRAGDEIVVPVFLAQGGRTIEVADGEVVGFGFRVFLDAERTVELREDDRAPVLPGVFYTPVAGVSFHDDVLQLPHFGAGRKVEIRPEPANAADHNALAVCSDGLRVGYLPAAIADVLAPAGTRVGRGMVVMEWSRNGERHGISVLGSMHVTLAVADQE